MERFTTIELSKEYLKFSASHFTIFSATERERLHGHNFAVSAKIVAPIDDNGLCFSYGELKKTIAALCADWDEYMLIPTRSPFLSIEELDTEYRLTFNGETMHFLKSDCLLLAIRNTTVEEFAGLLLERLLKDPAIIKYDVRQIEMRVSSGPGQWGSCEWQAPPPHSTT